MDARELPDHERRMSQARARAYWSIGDDSWADVIVGAYTDPDRDAAELRAEKGEE
jgi:hypothetical protein